VTPTDPISARNLTIQESGAKVYSASNLNLRKWSISEEDPFFLYDYTTNQTVNASGIVDLNDNPHLLGTHEYRLLHAGTNTVKLAGGTTGAGILLVDGNLEINGGFKWYGLIIVTGSVDYTGGGEKNVTGAVMCGETATVQVDVGGNAGIIYCSSVSNSLKNKVSPYHVTRWRDVF
jgi:hypothetical protein